MTDEDHQCLELVRSFREVPGFVKKAYAHELTAGRRERAFAPFALWQATVTVLGVTLIIAITDWLIS